MLITGIIHEHQKRGIMICIPKHTRPMTLEDYRPITFMNSDYKMLARIMAHRLQPALKEILHPYQYGGTKGGGIFEEAATKREAIAHTELTGVQRCIISLDFSQAFDKISHEYLFCILQEYGFSTQFITYIQNIYNDASSQIHINGHASEAIPIRRGVRQGCPLSMMLFTLCLNPLIWRLERVMQGIDIAGKAKTAVVAYADDLTIFLTDPREIAQLDESLQWYE